MNDTKTSSDPRSLTPEELGGLIKIFREVRMWSQEQLSAIADISTRSVQRIEKGAPSSLDTRRALARAFEFDDIDVFSKPLSIPTEDEVKAQKEAFDRTHVMLDAAPLTSGRQLGELAARHEGDISNTAFELDNAAAVVYAQLIDYIREFRDCHDLYTEVQKLEPYADMQALIDDLTQLGVAVRYAVRKVRLNMEVAADAKPMQLSILYLVAFRAGHEQDKVVVSRCIG